METIDSLSRQAPSPPLTAAARLTPGRRALDVAVALTLLLLLAPLLVLLAVLVRVTSGPPALFRQRRVGAGGGEFTLYKFRSMREGGAGPGVTGRADPRVTRTGRVLRRLSLDELPQLWNVLRGDMTLVGPRPEVPGLARRYPPEYRWVFRHRPGLTGPCQLRSRSYAAQLDGHPDPEAYYLAVQVPRRTALDAEFLSRPTLWNVLRYTARTVLYVLSAPWDRSQGSRGPGSRGPGSRGPSDPVQRRRGGGS
ncbi:sugar transferase [Streptomyces resistomycificus]|uniref:sugar transferase n=1 Tax=Streptomyces resistomycificus TaxID=67356 RepID=UPI0007C4D6ED|nr:sugar transferase [Streptomyces resistomycificus]